MTIGTNISAPAGSAPGSVTGFAPGSVAGPIFNSFTGPGPSSVAGPTLNFVIVSAFGVVTGRVAPIMIDFTKSNYIYRK